MGGGKGGVGKSFVASSLAIALARRKGSRKSSVVAIDLDFGGSNLNLFLGEPYPQREIADFLDGRAPTLSAIAQPTRLENLHYVAGSFDLITAVDPLRERKLDLVKNLVGFEADYVVLDLPAGSAASTLDFYFLGDIKLLITNPEAAAIHNAYGFLKNYVLRRLLTEFRDRKEIMGYILDYYRSDGVESDEPDRTITALVMAIREAYPESWAEVVGILEEDTPLLVLNRTRDRRERQFLDRFGSLVQSNLSLRCPPLGVISENRRVAKAIRKANPFLLAHPRHRITRQFDDWARRVVDSRR